jgi:hypothetical protein
MNKTRSEMVLEQNVRYSLTTAQIISRFAHRGSVEVERVLRRLWDGNRRTPLWGERGLVLVQEGTFNQWNVAIQKLLEVNWHH